jgi:hypothetical protein
MVPSWQCFAETATCNWSLGLDPHPYAYPPLPCLVREDGQQATVFENTWVACVQVPLVAATMGMYDLSQVPQDDQLWQLIALCAGMWYLHVQPA